MRLLLLAGTFEARHISVALSRESYLSVTVALARPDCQPKNYGWPVRIGGFGGEGAFRAYLEREGVDRPDPIEIPFACDFSR